MVNIRSMTKKTFCVKNPFFAKNALFSKNNVPKNFFFFGLIPNNSKHMSRNRRATIKVTQKAAHGKVF